MKMHTGKETLQTQVAISALLCLQFVKKRSFIAFFALLCRGVLFSTELPAQKILPFESGEELCYDVSYRYKIVMLRAGSARFSTLETIYNDRSSFFLSLDFRTTSFFDKIFKVRDTLRSCVDANLQPTYHERSVNEGHTNFVEQLFFLRRSPEQTEARIKREVSGEVKIDTVIRTNGLSCDLLSVFTFVRTLDYSNLQIGQSFPLVTFLGRQTAQIIIRYKGQSLIEKSETLKYKTLRFEADIVDDAFSSEKNAMEIWISDDDNRIPLKLIAQLKIGAAEATLSSYKNLKHPFTAEIKYPPRNF